ncbi:MAG TPA: hypothetical protein VD770_00500, partial [Coxiellaceae bacterium]|nr:hypothetical protein [Coxiellaceae bacterium]
MSFLSPPLVHKGPRVPTPGSAASVKTPYKKNIHPLPFLSPLTGYQKGDEFDLATQQAFEEFLFNAYFLEFEARKKAHDQHKEQKDQDDILSVVDSDVKARLKHYSRDELLQIKKFYKEFTALIAAMMNHLHSFTEDMPDDLVNAAVENLKPLKSEQFVQNDLEAYLMTAAANLERFNVQFKAILTKVDWYNSKEAWCFYMALLAFAIGL